MEKLFDAVNTKSYLPPPEQPSSGSLKVEFFQHQEKETKKEEVGIDFILNVCLFFSISVVRLCGSTSSCLFAY